MSDASHRAPLPPVRRAFAPAAFVGAALALAGCGLEPPDGGATWRASNGMIVVADATRATGFSVVSQPRAGPSDFWCAAGDYAERRLGARPVTPVFIAEGRVPSPLSWGRFAVSFALEDPGAPVPEPSGLRAVLLPIDTPGVSVSAAQGRSFCRDSRRRMRHAGLGAL